MKNTPIDYFTNFLTDISSFELPKKFTYPFYYTPHPLCELASKELQDFLVSNSNWSHNFGVDPLKKGREAGKMFGVLLVKKKCGQVGYLKAYSGKIESENEPAGFVPHIYDELKEKDSLERSKKEINLLTSNIEKIQNSKRYQVLKLKVEEMTEQEKRAISKQKQYMREAKAKRAIKRKSPTASADLIKELNYESLLNKFVLKSLVEYWHDKTKRILHEYDLIQRELNNLLKQRKLSSIKLQDELMGHYEFLNKEKEQRGLNEIFKNLKDKAPAGTGDCAAPKLLQYAFKNDLIPLAMAEFWWGAPHKSAIRTHKNFYPACKSKCQPLLSYMLDGIEVDENPINIETPQLYQIQDIYEDDDILIINKPSGLLSVAGKVLKDSVQTRMQKRFPKHSCPLIVHRLDQCTSGLMIITKTKKANKEIQAQFINKQVQKRYVAKLDGLISSKEGLIDLPLRVDLENRPYQLVCYEYGKYALTQYQVIGIENGKTRVYFWPKTGRTHQLRVHSAHPKGLQAAIVGDDLYGKKSTRLLLHAQKIEFIHPTTKRKVCFEVSEDF